MVDLSVLKSDDHPDGWDPALRVIAQLRQAETSTPQPSKGLLVEPGDVVMNKGNTALRLQQTWNTSGAPLPADYSRVVLETTTSAEGQRETVFSIRGGQAATQELCRVNSLGQFQQNLALAGYDHPRQQHQQLANAQQQGLALEQYRQQRQQQLAQMQSLGTWWGGGNTLRTCQLPPVGSPTKAEIKELVADVAVGAREELEKNYQPVQIIGTPDNTIRKVLEAGMEAKGQEIRRRL